MIGRGVRAHADAGRDLVGVSAQHMVRSDEEIEAETFDGLGIVAHDRGAGADIADGKGRSELHGILLNVMFALSTVPTGTVTECDFADAWSTRRLRVGAACPS